MLMGFRSRRLLAASLVIGGMTMGTLAGCDASTAERVARVRQSLDWTSSTGELCGEIPQLPSKAASTLPPLTAGNIDDFIAAVGASHRSQTEELRQIIADAAADDDVLNELLARVDVPLDQVEDYDQHRIILNASPGRHSSFAKSGCDQRMPFGRGVRW